MNKFLIALLIALVSCDIEIDTMLHNQFQKFIKKYNKKYQSVNEYLARFEVFKMNVMGLLKEKQSQEISCLHEILFLVKISLENPTKSIKIQFIKQSFEI